MRNTFGFNLYNTELFGQYWQPDTVKAVVVLVHGMGEYSSRYSEFVVPELMSKKFAVVTFDLFGHGKTKGKRGHCPSYNALLEAIDFVIKKSQKLFPDVPTFLYGHSLGGNLVINFTLQKPHNLKGVVATSPFLRLAFQPPKWKMVLGKFMFNIMPSITLPSELETNAISRDESQVKKYIEDALVHDKVSPMFTFPVIDAGVWAIKNAHKLNTPMLVLHGTGDRIIDYKGSEDFCKNTTMAHLELYQDGYHELHNDTCKNEFMQTVLSWLENVNLKNA